MDRIIFYITIVLTAAFLILSRTFSPIWLLVFALAVLWPWRRSRDVRPVFLIDLLLFGLYFLIHHFGLLAPFLVGFGIAYIFAPAVDFLQRRRISKIISILVILVPIGLIFPLVIFLVVTNLINEIQLLIEKIPDVIQSTQVLFNNISARLEALGIGIDPDFLTSTITSHLGGIANTLIGSFTQLGQGIKGILVLLYNCLVIPFTAYLILFDRKKIMDWFRSAFPADEANRIDGFMQRLNVSLASFFRGQFILMVLVGVFVGTALWLLGVRYYLLIAIVTALCNLIPNVGFAVSLIFALLIGLTTPSPMAYIAKIGVVFLADQILEQFVLVPFLIGRASQLNPVLVMIVLVMGGALLGVWGVIIAVPVTIFLREFLNHFLGMKL